MATLLAITILVYGVLALDLAKFHFSFLSGFSLYFETGIGKGVHFGAPYKKTDSITPFIFIFHSHPL